MDPATPDATLAERKVLVALSGGIACYKTATLVSHLVQRGAEVRVVMTQAATRFLGPLTLQSLSGRPVVTSIWETLDAEGGHESPHIALARWADLMVIAPCSADLLARLASGLTDDPVSLIAAALPAETPLLLAPAMNADMWAHPIVQRNLATLHDLLPNLHQVGPEAGWQACRTRGEGRMSEPEAIFDAIENLLAADTQS